MAFDPTWPVIDEAISFTTSVQNNLNSTANWVSVLNRSINTQSIQRGRAYELNIVQTGEYNPELSNTDGFLSPLNTAGPWFGAIQPYSLYRKRAQFPPTQQLLTQFQATSGTLPTALTAGTLLNSLSGQGVYSLDSTATFQTLTSGMFNSQSTVIQALTTTANQPPVYYNQFTIFLNTPMSFSVYCAQTSTGTTTLSVDVYVTWFNAANATISSSAGTPVTLTAWSGTPNWQQVAVTATPPATAVGGQLVLNNNAAGAGSIYIAGAQIELAAAPTAFTQPGVWY